MAREFDDKMESDFLNIFFRTFTAEETKTIVHRVTAEIIQEESDEHGHA